MGLYTSTTTVEIAWATSADHDKMHAEFLALIAHLNTLVGHSVTLNCRVAQKKCGLVQVKANFDFATGAYAG